MHQSLPEIRPSYDHQRHEHRQIQYLGRSRVATGRTSEIPAHLYRFGMSPKELHGIDCFGSFLISAFASSATLA